MITFGILHLSDLHISSKEDPSNKELRQELIKDIKKMQTTKNIRIDSIAMTGDVVDKGGDPRAFDLALEFFENLCNECDIKKENIIFVPGNHDIPRRSRLVTSLIEDDFYDEDISTEHWESLKIRFKDFENFTTLLTGRTDFIDSNLGSGTITLDINNFKVKFLLLNSSWSTVGESDYNNLLIGKWQLERLKQLSKASENGDLTFLLMHHPIDWLRNEEKDLLTQNLINNQDLYTNFILHGHIHDGKFESYSNPDGTIRSLVTGIGYPDKSQKGPGISKNSKCRYSIYNFNLDENKIQFYLRVSNEYGKFVSDTNLYAKAGDNGEFEDYIRFPSYNEQFQLATIKQTYDISNVKVDSIKRVSDWVGREDELKLIKSKNLSALAITGTGGQGKSALASEILRRYTQKGNTQFDVGIWIDCRELPDSLHYKIIETLDKISGGKESSLLYKDEQLKDTVKRFGDYLSKHKLLLVFDNIDAYIRLDTEGPAVELEPFLNCILETNHNSLVIFTSRPSLIHHSSDFYNLRLGGLSEKDGIEFFKKRDIKLENNNSIDYCKKIIELTKGHPYWLGLIAGQLDKGSDNFKTLVRNFSLNNVPERRRIQEYFKNIWDQLNNDRQKLLRYLVEAHRPLTDSEILILDKGPHKIRQELRRLERLGLLEPHSNLHDEEVLYQVHPLVREFIHETFTTQAQEQFVQKVLYVFLPKTIVDMLFTNPSNITAIESVTPSAILESLETCLNSRNTSKALTLIEQYQYIIQNSGFHHQFLSVGCRILDSIDWEEENLVNNFRSQQFLDNIINQLIHMGDSRFEIYLKQYESLVESNTKNYLKYLALLADVEWKLRNYESTIKYSFQYEDLAGKLDDTTGIIDVKYSRALALRDSDKADEALSLFNEVRETRSEDDKEYLGNCAKCYHKLGDYDNAIKYLNKSLKLLLKDNTYQSRTNLGYAYLWFSEIMYDQHKISEAKEYLEKAEQIWREYAPGLLYIVEDKYNLFAANKNWVNV
ncbi:hypothetical protein AEA09_06095 [Lysinibacillus contaminans]|uniref:Calcineurin-like phosphoesterase domain-containing protein n=1 Tax=Lysinibacillus contaminans TaxID=1293441 RepID=A0ABR5JZV4_9BACI|nr:NB-ARC domain-containing protein [Lysinibacillus contaminans]KOS68166.1 hypothetical protein AEA09_06095 [Lysinibacillus contaminans]